MSSAHGSVFGGALLVTGTCIGAGMLALPVLTSLGGFLPAVVIYFLCWLFMSGTGLLFLEVCLWMEPDSNIISMATHLLGRLGKAIVWILYLYLFYSLTVAYVAGGGSVVTELFDDRIPRWAAIVAFVALFALFVYIGPRAVDRANVILVIGLALTYVTFVALGLPHVQLSTLAHRDWLSAWYALPVVFVSFGFQGIVPTLTTYMRHHPQKIRAAILIGTALPFLTYVIWEWLILGMVPLEGAHGLKEAIAQGKDAVWPLKNLLEAPWIFVIGEFFAFFALTSSFLGVTLGLRDFLADALKVKKTAQGRLWLCVAIFVPALLISLIDPRLFLLALRYGGGIGGALLLGLLPIVLVWVGRYHRHLKGPYHLMGGRPLLILMALFVLIELASEVL